MIIKHGDISVSGQKDKRVIKTQAGLETVLPSF